VAKLVVVRQPFSPQVYFEGDLKLMTGNSIGGALWMGPFYPNKSTDFSAQSKVCGWVDVWV
jgi:hypothetical protein